MWRTIKKQDIKHHKTDLIDTYRIMIARRFTNFATDAFIRVLVSLQAITHTCRFIQIFIYSLFILWFLISVLVWLLLSSDFFFFFYSSALVLFNSYQYQKQWTNKPFVMVFFLLALSLSFSFAASTKCKNNENKVPLSLAMRVCRGNRRTFARRSRKNCAVGFVTFILCTVSHFYHFRTIKRRSGCQNETNG